MPPVVAWLTPLRATSPSWCKTAPTLHKAFGEMVSSGEGEQWHLRQLAASSADDPFGGLAGPTQGHVRPLLAEGQEDHLHRESVVHHPPLRG